MSSASSRRRRSADTPYEAKAELLPRTLAEALERAAQGQGAARRASARRSSTTTARIKEAEIARYNLEVSEWEQREYFDLF